MIHLIRDINHIVTIHRYTKPAATTASATLGLSATLRAALRAGVDESGGWLDGYGDLLFNGLGGLGCVGAQAAASASTSALGWLQLACEQ